MDIHGLTMYKKVSKNGLKSKGLMNDFLTILQIFLTAIGFKQNINWIYCFLNGSFMVQIVITVYYIQYINHSQLW